MTEENGDHLFVPIAAKWLASETDDGGGDDDDGDDVAQMRGARKQVFHVCHASAAVLMAQLDYAAEMPDVN